MAFIFTDSSGSTCSITVANAGGAVYRLKELMKAAGWVHQASSDGTNVSNTAGNANDQITSAAEMATNNAWIVLAKGNRQLIFRRGTSDSNWLVVYVPRATDGSQQAPTAAGTTAAIPQYTTRHALIGTLPDTAAAWFTSASARRWSMGADDDPSSPALYMAGWNTGTGDPAGAALMIDPLAEGTYHPDDDDPIAIYCVGSTSMLRYQTLMSDTLGFAAYYRRGLTGEQWLNIAALGYACYQGVSAEVVLTGSDGSFAGSPHDPHLVNLLPVVYCRRGKFGSAAVAAPGIKGVGTLWRWRMARVLTGRLLTAEVENDRIVIGDAILPWDPAVTPHLW